MCWLVKVDVDKALDWAIVHFVVGLTTDGTSRRGVVGGGSADEHGKGRCKVAGGIVASFIKAETSLDGPGAEGIGNIIFEGNFLMCFDVGNINSVELGGKLDDSDAYRN